MNTTAVIDTNVLIYAVDLDAPEHRRCSDLLHELRVQATPWYVTWGVLYEFMRVATHPRVLNEPMSPSKAWQFITSLLACRAVCVLVETQDHPRIAHEVFSEIPELRGTHVFDARTAILMKEHGVSRIITRDTGFFRFPFLEVIDPLQSPPSRVAEGRGRYAVRRRRSPAGKV